MGWRLPHNPTPYDDDWEDQPAQGPFYQWVLGMVVPMGIFAFGIQAIATRQTEYGGNISMPLHGVNAISLGIAAVSAAIFLHCHYFWGNIYNQIWFAVLGKIVAACGFIVGLGILLVRVGVLGIQ